MQINCLVVILTGVKGSLVLFNISTSELKLNGFANSNSHLLIFDRNILAPIIIVFGWT